jgi:TolB-like protein/tRNA A-37 threonylcarbamoyl transferase component Bud32/Tfp pilus assembly protein PilF
MFVAIDLLKPMSLQAGNLLGPYEILAPIGAGGMGEVWKARDTRLGRIVAIKRLAAEHMARFQQEARAIAAMNHANICQIHDVGPDYLVMEYVEGKPLSGPLPVEDAVRLAIQITSALEEAHGNHILHCDLKPNNILVTSKGAAKLLDFGLAKLTADCDPEDTTTMEGTIKGTAAYMAPEQAEGKALDERSDIFSFGAVFYEMLSGRRAFGGNTMAQVLSAVLRDEPRPLDAPAALDRIVRCCLSKQPAQRFHNAAELRAALEQFSAKPLEQRPSIAVLPFANLSADKENEYFSDGLAEEILNALSQVEGLSVAARSSSFSFKGKDVEISEIAAKLRVATVLEGSVRRAGNRVRVTVQLVDAKNGFHLWSERYDRQMEDIFDVQDEIARAITERLKVTLAGGVKQATKNLEAYELYLKGRHYWHQRSPAAMRLAIQCFEQAIQLDPEYALAHAGLADCYGVLRVYGWVSAEDSRPPALAALTRALTLAPSLWEVTFSRAFYVVHFEHAWREAGPCFQKAIAINPRSSVAHVYYAVFLAVDERAEDAVRHAALACQLDPLSAFIHGMTSVTLYLLGRFDEGERAARQALELQPGYLLGLWFRALALCGLGRNKGAVDALEQVIAISRAPIYLGFLGLAYARAGRLDDANRLLRELEDRSSRGEYVPAFAPLSIYVGQGDLPEIRRTLSEGLQEATSALALRCVTIHFPEAVRTDPEISRLLAELYG